MRELKFRAWDIKKNRYGEVLTIDWFGKDLRFQEYCLLHESAEYWKEEFHKKDGIEDITGGDIWECNFENCIIEQFTGLLDKNGKEIYEGDIVAIYNKNDGSLQYREIIFKNGGYIFECLYGKSDIYLLGNLPHCYEIEVCGNIRENKSLFYV